MPARNFAPHDEANEAVEPPSFAAKFRTSPLAALFAVVALIALFAYAISAWQVYGFARYVWAVPILLCFAAAVIADLLSLAGLFATYLLRNAKWIVRAYAWFVFLLMTGLSIAAAESYAHWRTLDEVAQQLATQKGGEAAQVASGSVVVALALSVHLLIIVRRHATTEAPPRPSAPRQVKAPTAPKAPPEKPVEKPVERKNMPAEIDSHPDKPRRPMIRRRGGRDNAKRVEALQLLDEGKRPAEVAKHVGVSTRSVQIWASKAKEAKDQAGGVPPAIAAIPAAPIDAKPQVNGHDVRTPSTEEVS